MMKTYGKQGGKTVAKAIACLSAALFSGLIVLAAVPAAGVQAGTGNNLVGAPSVVARLESVEQLGALSDDAPASLIVEMDGEGNAVGADGSAIGTPGDVYKNYIQGNSILIVEVDNTAEAEKLAEIWGDELGENDMAVMSADAQALTAARTALPEIRGIYDCTAADLSAEAACYEQVRASTLAMANVVVLSEEQSTVENVAYFQGRFKTVWTELDDEHEGDAFAIQNVVSSGAYGIVCSDYAAVYAAYRQYPRYALARISRNIAHRGLPMTEAENSVAGALAAVEGGATHIEIDVHLTSDGQVVVMHDDTIDRTTDGHGAVASMTLEQLRQYSITKTYGGQVVDPQPIPTIGDFFDAFEQSDVVIVCEIKTSDTDVLQALGADIEEHNFWDRIVFISFDMDMLAAAHEQLPQVPTASLASFPARYFELLSAQYNAINTVVDAAWGELVNEEYYDVEMKDRGYMSYAWTYDTASGCASAMSGGIYGLTNNDAEGFGRSVGALCGQEGQTLAVSEIDFDSLVNVVVTTYAGNSDVREGGIFNYRDCGTYAEVIAWYNDGQNILFTPAFRVDYSGAQAPAGGGTDNTGLIIGLLVGGGVLVLGAAVAAMVVIRRRKRQ